MTETVRVKVAHIKEMERDIFKLWNVLDDISTLCDMFKPEHDAYFKAVEKKISEGLQICKSDGYRVFYKSKCIG